MHTCKFGRKGNQLGEKSQNLVAIIIHVES